MIPRGFILALGSAAAEASTRPVNAISIPIISNLVSFRLTIIDEKRAISKGATAINNILIPADAYRWAAKNEPKVKVVHKKP